MSNDADQTEVENCNGNSREVADEKREKVSDKEEELETEEICLDGDEEEEDGESFGTRGISSIQCKDNDSENKVPVANKYGPAHLKK